MNYLRKRILLIDDEEWNNEIVKEILKEEFDVLSITSIADWNNALSNFRPDLILLDVMMPGMNGFELCKKIKSNNLTKNLRIIFVSAFGSCTSRLQGYKSGADDFISKPFDHSELLAKVRVHTQLRYIEELDSIKTNVLRLICHETRTPLNGIFGVAQLLRENNSLSDEEKGFVSILFDSVKQLENTFQKSELFIYLQNQTPLNCKQISIQSLIEKVVENNKKEINRKDNQIEFTLENNTPDLINADESLIETALIYLVENALKFSPEGEKIKIVANSNDGYTSFHISNKGTPIPEKIKDSLFIPLEPLDIDHHTKGQYLGLPIVSRIAQLHGGILKIEENTEQEVKFNFSIKI